MTWTAKIMPDDQLDPASLVGGMLQVGQQGEITGDGSGEALPVIDGPVATEVREAPPDWTSRLRAIVAHADHENGPWEPYVDGTPVKRYVQMGRPYQTVAAHPAGETEGSG